jgi:leucyl aminopeptidase
MAKTPRSAKEPLSVDLAADLPGAADALAVALFEKTAAVPAALKGVDAATGGALGRAIALGDYKGKLGTAATIPLEGKIKRLVLVGLGKRERFDSDALRWAAGLVAKLARVHKFATAALYVHAEVPESLGNVGIAEAITEGLILASFTYTEFKGADGGKKEDGARRFTIVAPDVGTHKEMEEGIASGRILAEACNYTRTISCKPGNVINPPALAAEARALAAREKLQCTVINAEQARRMGMGGLVGVGQGSATPPVMIVLEYTGPGTGREAPVAVVGKAVTFDTGGISIKPANDMNLMKYDKCGGCAVLGIMQAVARMRLRLRIVGVIPSAENTLSGTAYRPGDILRFFNGKTAEITNTDAEGRLILADALAYAAATYKPSTIIDMATLTGACNVALGAVFAGLFSNNDALAAELTACGAATGERLWRLPLHERYKAVMEGNHSDLVNSAMVREAGASLAAIFLQHFVPENVPWAHLDIAGTAAHKTDDRYFVKGATGFGTRVVTDYLRRRAAAGGR